jgi:hypothetical protein
MTLDLSRYLEDIKRNSKLDPAEESEVISEIQAHIEDEVQDLTDSGISREEAVNVCLSHIGSARQISRQIYEAYSQGSWKQVMLASMPHLLFGLLFVLNWWHHAGWIAILLVSILVMTIYGWWHGKPSWVFPWLGYSLLPVLLVGSILLYLPHIWSLLTIPLYLPLALWWLIHIVIQSSKRDWLFGSIMLLPIPVVVSWFIFLCPQANFSQIELEQVYSMAPWIGLSFLVLSLTIVLFIRIRQRHLRIFLLVTSELLTLGMIAHATSGTLTLLTILGSVIAIWGIILIPSFMERRFRTGRLWFYNRNRPTPMLSNNS